MAENFGRDKKRIEAMKRKRREEKRNKRQNKNTEAVPPATAVENQPSSAEG
jgi:hypothetical protein